MRGVRIVLGLICGAVLGTMLGIAVAMGLGRLSQWQHPNDHSAGSVAIIVIATAPVGGLIGATVGAALVTRWMNKSSSQPGRSGSA